MIFHHGVEGEIMVLEMAVFTTEQERWDAVSRRDDTADGVFYYSVKTTGVYCRPSCASRGRGARTSLFI